MKGGLLKYYLTAAFVVLIDQSLKLWVYFNMEMGYPGLIKLLGNWLKLCYTLNPGMAYGIQLGSKYGKFLLTLGRIVATFLISSYLFRMRKKRRQSSLQLLGWSLILGGAIGNVIDSVFYAALLKLAHPSANTPMMAWFHGPVIDMIFLHIVDIKLPAWVPLIGGSCWSIFPVCNLADLAIILGISVILWTRVRGSKHHQVMSSSMRKDSIVISSAESAVTPSELVENL